MKDEYKEVQGWERRWKREVVGALAAGADDRYCRAWAEVMEVSVGECLDELSELNGSYPVLGSSAITEAAPISSERDLIFTSFSHKDQKLCNEFLQALQPAAHALQLEIWSDQDIETGAEWRKKIEGALKRARVAVCLVSPDYLTSRFVNHTELPVLLAAAKSGGVEIFWIACRPSTVQHTQLAKYQAANNPERPLSTLPKKDRERAIVEIVNKLIVVANRVAER